MTRQVFDYIFSKTKIISITVSKEVFKTVIMAEREPTQALKNLLDIDKVHPLKKGKQC